MSRRPDDRRIRRQRIDRSRRFLLETLERRAMLAADAGLLSKTPVPAWFASLPTAQPVGATTVNEWIVQLSDRSLKTIQSVADAGKALARPSLGIQVVKGLGMPGQLLVSATGSAATVTSFLRRHPLIQHVESNAKIEMPLAAPVPNDPRYGDLWGLNNVGQAGGTVDADIDAAEAWEISTGSDSVIVAVIDTGIDVSHPDLRDNIWVNPGEVAGDGIDNDGNGFIDDINGWDFANDDASVYDGPDDDHGTHCAGTIAGRGNNRTGVVGVGWNTQIMSLKFLDGGGSTADAIAAINYVTAMKTRGVNVRVTNNSWGGGGFSEALKDAIEAGGREGILFVAAAGNGGFDGIGDNNDDLPFYPASYNSSCIVAVAATDRNDALGDFSNFGQRSVDVGAPGVSILSTVPERGYAEYDGTSMAAPHVSGVTALALAVDPSLSVEDLKAAILESTDKIPSLTGKTVTGGRLNALKTLEYVQPSLKLLSVTPSGPVPAPIGEIVATFSEKVHPDSVTVDNFVLTGDGLDGVAGNADDVTVAIAGVAQTVDGVVTLTLASPLNETERYILVFKGTGTNPLRNVKDRSLGQIGMRPEGKDVEHRFMVRNFVEPNDRINPEPTETDPGEVIRVLQTSGVVAIEGMIGDGEAAIRDVDLYQVSLEAGQMLLTDVNARSLPEGSTLDSFVRIFDATGRQLAMNDDALGELDSYLRFRAPKTGVYYVGISGFGNAGYDPRRAGSGAVGSSGDYQVTLSFSTPTAPLTAEIVPVTPDPRTTAVGRIEIVFNRPVVGLDVGDLKLTRDDTVVSMAGATVTPSPDRTKWILGGQVLEQATTAAGRYLLMLNAEGSGILDGNRMVLSSSPSDAWEVVQQEVPPGGDPPPSSDDEPGDVIGAARSLDLGVVQRGRIGDGPNKSRDVDLYKVSLAAGQTIMVDIDARSLMPESTLDSVVRVFQANGKLLAANDNDLRTRPGSRDSFLEFRAREAGDYYIGVSGVRNASYNPVRLGLDRRPGSIGDYHLTVTGTGTGGFQPTALGSLRPAAAAFAAASSAPAPVKKWKWF